METTGTPIRNHINTFVGDKYGLKSIPQDSIKNFIDFGANVGLISIFARMLHPHMSIFSVEPNLKVYESLKNNTNNLKIHTYNLALGDGNEFGLTKIRKSAVCNKWLPGSTEQLIKSHTLEWFINEFDINPLETMLKFDCEGAEHFLTNNESLSILKRCKMVAFEVHYLDRKRTVDTFLDYILKNMSDSYIEINKKDDYAFLKVRNE